MRERAVLNNTQFEQQNIDWSSENNLEPFCFDTAKTHQFLKLFNIGRDKVEYKVEEIVRAAELKKKQGMIY